MVESFAEEPNWMNWRRVWNIAVRRPNLESGIAVLNFMERDDNATWSAAYFEDIEMEGTKTPPAFEACVFAHIQDRQSLRSLLNPLNWIGDVGGYHHNDYSNCGRFLAKRSKPYMRTEWERLATFTRNTHLRGLAREILQTSGRDDGAGEFSDLVNRIRDYRQQMSARLWGRSQAKAIAPRNPRGSGRALRQVRRR